MAKLRGKEAVGGTIPAKWAGQERAQVPLAPASGPQATDSKAVPCPASSCLFLAAPVSGSNSTLRPEACGKFGWEIH